MAHFARIENDRVVSVLAVPNRFEDRGPDFLAVDMKLGGEWIQTSYNARFRGKYAGIGDIYDRELDVFRPADILEDGEPGPISDETGD